VIIKFNTHEHKVAKKDLEVTVKNIMEEAVKSKNGGLRGIISDELVIELRKPDVPTIDLIDLPGIVAASLPDEPSDMMNRTRELVEKYVNPPDPNIPKPIVVVVVPATIKRVRDSQAMQIVQKLKAEARSFGVLSMADLVHDPFGADPYWELRERLNGVAQDLVVLPKGYVAVVSRDTRRKHDIAASAQHEQAWFSEKLPEFDRTTTVSTCALIRRLDDFYSDHIRDHWVPKALEELQSHRKLIAEEAKLLGTPPSEMNVSDLLTFIASNRAYIQDYVHREYCIICVRNDFFSIVF
jgi:hypothetical protein